MTKKPEEVQKMILLALLNTGSPAICLVGKTWDFHVDVALGISKKKIY